MTARQDSASAGKAAGDALALAERHIIAAMTTAAASVVRGRTPPAVARRRVQRSADMILHTASAALATIYDQAVHGITGQPGTLPSAPGQVAAAILRAQSDTGTAFGAVLSAALGTAPGVRRPPPASPYSRIAASAARQPTPGKAALAAIDAISGRGLTGYVTPSGRRQPLAAYGARAVRVAVSQLARKPVLAEITARRDQLLDHHAAAVAAAWKQAAGELKASQALRMYRADSRVVSAAGDPAVAVRWRKEAAAAAILAMLSGMYRTAGYAALIAALEDMIRDGMAEGEADALALAAHGQGQAGFSLAAAFAAAQARLDEDMSVARQAQEAAAGIVAGTASEAARALAASKDGEDDSGEEAEEALAGSSAASRWADWSLWSAFGAGAVSLYRRISAGMFTGQGLMVDWNTDSSPCELCQENEDDGPYTPDNVPPYPGHPNCRCWLSSDSRIPASLMGQFLGLVA